MDSDIATAKDLENPADRRLFRFLEILPGFTSWLTLGLVVFLSWFQPLLVACFIISFDLYWFFRSVYFAFHLRSSSKRLEQAKNTDWLGKTKQILGWDEIYHVCFFSLCNESHEVVRDSFLALSNIDYPKDKIIVVLSAEQRYRQKTEDTVAKINGEFASRFFKFLTTWHPDNLPGEIPGKGSNDHWAGLAVKNEVIDVLKIPYEKLIATFLDVDTCVLPKYFSCLTYSYLTCQDPTRTSFQPAPLFINNIWQAPMFSRNFSMSNSFWHVINQERPERLITFSSHSMSFKALVEVGFKQPNVVSDDSRIFWQCFLNYGGNYWVQPLFYPVGMDATAAQGFWQTMVNVYKQQRRWAYGACEIPYVFFNFLKNKKISLKKKINQGLFLFESHWSWATNAILILVAGWLPVSFGRSRFPESLILHNLPQLTSRILTLAMIGLFVSIYVTFVFLPPRPKTKGKFSYLFFVLEWLAAPSIMIVFGALPALDAQTRLMFGKYMGFWVTEKVRKIQ